MEIQNRQLRHKDAEAKFLWALVQVLNGKLDGVAEIPATALGKAFRDAAPRLRELVSEIQELEQIGQELCEREPEAKDKNKQSGGGPWPENWPNFKFSDPKSKELDMRGRRILQGINTRLRRYKWSPAIVAVANAPHLQGFALADHVQPVRNMFSFDFETNFVRALLKLVTAGRLHCLRRCRQCQQWFFAFTDHQKYCNDNCRKRHAAYGESFKEKRRIYMRDYRRREKAEDEAAKLRAKKRGK
jgi:hypothetical protein